MRAGTLLAKGDLDGYAVFKRVVKAAEELLSRERPPGVSVQSLWFLDRTARFNPILERAKDPYVLIP